MIGRESRISSAACIALVAAATLGCTETDPESTLAELNKTNLQRVTNLYFAYQKKHNFQGPPDEEAFKAFVRDFSPRKLERIGVDPSAIDEVFISSRDGQPFKIRYGVTGSMMGSKEPVVFEAEGDGEKRRVGFLDMSQREVDAAEYDRLWTGQASVEPTARGAM